MIGYNICKALLDEYRGKAAEQGVSFRPAYLVKQDPLQEQQQASFQENTNPSASSSTSDLSDSKTWYLRVAAGAQGIMQIHEA